MLIEIEESLLRDLIYNAEMYQLELRQSYRPNLASRYQKTTDKAKQLLISAKQSVVYDIPVFGGYISSTVLKNHQITQKQQTQNLEK